MLVSHYKQSLFKQRPGIIYKLSTTYEGVTKSFMEVKRNMDF